MRIVPYDELKPEQCGYLRDYFFERIFPILTPLSVDISHPFPYISNNSLNLGISVVPENATNGEEPRFTRVKVPPNVPRLIKVSEEGHHYVLLDFAHDAIRGRTIRIDGSMADEFLLEHK